MKFTEQLSAHLTPEWRKQYVHYEKLRNKLVQAVERAPAQVDADPLLVKQYYANFDEDFFMECELQLNKVNNFFAEKLAEAKRKHTELNAELELFKAVAERKNVRLSRLDLRTVLPKRKTEQFKFIYSEFYLSLMLLQNYQTLNQTAFRKILKKHDKFLNSNTGNKWYSEHVENAPFVEQGELLKLIDATQTNFTNHLEGGDRQRAMKRLRVPPLEELQHPWVTFGVGFFLGMFVILAIVTVIKFNDNDLTRNNYIACIQLYRGPLLLVVFLFMISINVYGWRRAGVNHILIFEINPRDHLTASQVSQLAVIFAFICVLSICGFLYHKHLRIPPFAQPLILLSVMLVYLLNPFPCCYYTSRIWLIKLIGRVICAPFFPVGFADFWLGDQFNSLVRCFTDYKYIICFYVSNFDWYNARDPDECMESDHLLTALVRCLPAWFRFAQCMRRYKDTRLAYPFLVNAMKYATQFPVITFGTLMAIHRGDYANTFDNPYVWGYLIAHTVHGIYTYAWDMLRDFGIFQKFSGDHIFLRDHIVYHPAFYYFAIIEDFLLRFLWAFSFYMLEQNFITHYHMNTINGFLEAFRRYIWNYFRLEHEHIGNVGMFRAVRDISLAPIDPTDQIKLTRMMDELDGVENRRNTWTFFKSFGIN